MTHLINNYLVSLNKLKECNIRDSIKSSWRGKREISLKHLNVLLACGVPEDRSIDICITITGVHPYALTTYELSDKLESFNILIPSYTIYIIRQAAIKLSGTLEPVILIDYQGCWKLEQDINNVHSPKFCTPLVEVRITDSKFYLVKKLSDF